MTEKIIKVVIIEDDPMVQEVNRQFISHLKEFQIIGSAANGHEGMELIKQCHPDLVLIDLYMPVQDGLETLLQIRQEGLNIDVIAITAASDMETVRMFLQHGAFDYIMKPFKFERLKKALDHYYDYRLQFRKQKQKNSQFSQKELDEILFQKNAQEGFELPKGLNGVTLAKISTYLAQQQVPSSAEDVAEAIGIARVTARRYLDYLDKCGKVIIDIQYGGVGRPVNRYILNK